MKDNLISVKLHPIDVRRLAELGFISLYGLDPIDTELQLGRSQIPEKWTPLFCSEEEQEKFPEFYSKRSEEYSDSHDWSNGDDEFVRQQQWYDCWYKVCSLRHVPGHWTISSGDYLYVFDGLEQCLQWLKGRKNYEGFLVRDPSGAHKEIQVSIELVNPS